VEEPVIEESVTEEPIADEPVIEEVKVEEPTTIPQPQVVQERPINRLTYASRNASNVSVQRI
jgi:hypothetical protein